MARAPSFFLSFFRQNPRARQNPNAHFRNLSIESKEGDFKVEGSKSNTSPDAFTENTENTQGHRAEIVKRICEITREQPRWEQSLLSDFPSINFLDPLFYRELLSEQTDVLVSLRFFMWLRSNYDFSPDPASCSLLFDALVEAKAGRAAKSFLENTGFSPEPASLEAYIKCLCGAGLIEEAIDVYLKLKGTGIRPSIVTYNSVFLCCLKIGNTNLIWKLYEEMIELGIVRDANVETVGYLIQACCSDGQVMKGYELLKQALEDGLDPGSVTYNKLVAGFCQMGNYDRMSEILHIMIARNHAPSIYMYQEIINGICKKRKRLEAYRVFNDLKDRGYAPDKVMYTTMIHGLCEMGWLGDARKLWFEMIVKGMLPNEFTYNAMFYGYLKIGDFGRANELYQEMCEKGYGETTVSCNTVISGLCLHGRLDDALNFFEKMSAKGIHWDSITYNTMIRGFCKGGKISEGMNMLKKLIAQGLQPSVSAYNSLIELLCQHGDVEEAKWLWDDMINRGLEATVCTRDHLIAALCEQGCVLEGLDWLMAMLENKLKPQKTTFEKLILCLMQVDRLDDSLFILHCMLRIGYALRDDLCHCLISKLCQNNSDFVERSLGKILAGS